MHMFRNETRAAKHHRASGQVRLPLDSVDEKTIDAGTSVNDEEEIDWTPTTNLVCYNGICVCDVLPKKSMSRRDSRTARGRDRQEASDRVHCAGRAARVRDRTPSAAYGTRWSTSFRRSRRYSSRTGPPEWGSSLDTRKHRPRSERHFRTAHACRCLRCEKPRKVSVCRATGST